MPAKIRKMPPGGADHSTRRRILDAALEIIGQEGAKHVTIRRLAGKAGVNIASIHYHFQSRENIVNESLKLLFSEITEALGGTEDGSDPRKRLKDFLLRYTEYFARYPGVFISQISFMLDYGRGGNPKRPVELSPILSETIGMGSRFLMRTIGHISGIKDEGRLGLIAVQVMTNVAHPIFLTDMPQKLFGLDYKNPADRVKYIGMVLEAHGLS